MRRDAHTWQILPAMAAAKRSCGSTRQHPCQVAGGTAAAEPGRLGIMSTGFLCSCRLMDVRSWARPAPARRGSAPWGRGRRGPSAGRLHANASAPRRRDARPAPARHARVSQGTLAPGISSTEPISPLGSLRNTAVSRAVMPDLMSGARIVRAVRRFRAVGSRPAFAWAGCPSWSCGR